MAYSFNRERFERAIKEAGYTLKSVSLICHLSETAARDIVKGRSRSPGLEVVWKIANQIGKDVSYFIDQEDGGASAPKSREKGNGPADPEAWQFAVKRVNQWMKRLPLAERKKIDAKKRSKLNKMAYAEAVERKKMGFDIYVSDNFLTSQLDERE